VNGGWAFALYTSTHLSFSDYLYKIFEEIAPVFRIREFYRFHGKQSVALTEKPPNHIPPSISFSVFL